MLYIYIHYINQALNIEHRAALSLVILGSTLK